MTKVILIGMKTAISLPDELFARAEQLAARLGIARSRLYALALSEYVDRHTSSSVTQQLNAIYADEESELDDGLRRLQVTGVTNDQTTD